MSSMPQHSVSKIDVLLPLLTCVRVAYIIYQEEGHQDKIVGDNDADIA